LLVPWSDRLFGKPDGYVDVVTDISAPQWHRFYVGQSVGFYSRIREHLGAIQDRKSARLHHYVASRPGRRSTFMITTDINSSGLSARQLELLLDVLEMAQGPALQSLPEATLVAYLPPGALIANPNVNLNIASPLLQHSISPLDKEIEVEKLATSQDPDIRGWFEARKMRKAIQKIGPRVIKKHYQPSPKDAQGYREAFINI